MAVLFERSNRYGQRCVFRERETKGEESSRINMVGTDRN